MELEIITSNDHKFDEISEKFSHIDIAVIHNKRGYPETQADTIKDVCRYSLGLMIPVIGGNFVIEDAGLEIDHLSGFPGPYSSFVFKTLGNDGILSLMKGIEDRSARFYSVIGLYYAGESYLFQGVCEGSISTSIHGDKGFGFDPIFIPNGYSQTFAEIELTEKNKISHRSKSVDLLVNFIKNRMK